MLPDKFQETSINVVVIVLTTVLNYTALKLERASKTTLPDLDRVKTCRRFKLLKLDAIKEVPSSKTQLINTE